MPLADVAELMQRGFDGGVHGGLEPDDATLETLGASPAVFRLGQGVRDVNRLAAHVGDAKKHAAGFTRQPAVTKPCKFGEKIVVVGDRPLAERPCGAAGAARRSMTSTPPCAVSFQTRTACIVALERLDKARARRSALSSAALVAGMRFVRARHEPL